MCPFELHRLGTISNKLLGGGSDGGWGGVCGLGGGGAFASITGSQASLSASTVVKNTYLFGPHGFLLQLMHGIITSNK